MILRHWDANETDISIGSSVFAKDENYEVHIEWEKLTPATREALSEIAIQAEELRAKSVEVLKRDFPKSGQFDAHGDFEVVEAVG